MFTRLRRVFRIQLVVLILALAGVLVQQGTTNRVSATASTSTVIVELKGEPAAVWAARARQSGRTVSDEELQGYRNELSAAQDQFLAALANRGVNATVITRAIKDPSGNVAANIDLRYTLVYNGLALTVPSEAVNTLREMPEVKGVQPNQTLWLALNNSVKYIGAPKVYGAVPELTQFDNLREGYEGQGINIAVIDTGIDWTHPMFGGDPTPPRLGVLPQPPTNTNQKVIYHLPLTDVAAEDAFGHGTHVASTAAGYLAQHPGKDGAPLTGDEFNLHGVAPQAKLMSYTVCSNLRSIPGSLGLPSIGGCDSADTIMALEDAVSPFTLTPTRQAGQTPAQTPFTKPVAHVINLSLGGSGGPDSPTAVACSNAALTGATVVASSGNSGPGEGTTGAPAAGTHVISVGANTHPGAMGTQWSSDLLQASAFPVTRTGAVTPASSYATAAGTTRIRLFPMSGTSNLPQAAMAQRYVYVGNATTGFPATVSGRIALVRSFSGAFATLAAQAQAAGAVGMIVFDDRGTVNGVKTMIPAATIPVVDGEVLVDAISSTDNNAVNPPNGTLSELPLRMNPFFNEAFMGEMGDFSSRGPVRGLGQIKPDISAPGVGVLAAVPPASLLGAIGTLENTPQYAHLDGTSMSAPHVAGAAALIRQAHPDWTADVVRTALINTATNMRNLQGGAKADGPSTADSIIAQGGGLINVPEALNAKALMGVEGDGIEKPGILGSHSFGEVPVIDSRVTHTETVTVTIRDLSGQGGTYNLGVANNRDLQLAGINVSLSSQSVQVPAGGEATYQVRATVDGNLLRDVMAAKTVGSQVIFEKIQMQWYVTANRADGGESLRMPFFFRPGRSVAAASSTTTETFEGTIIGGDAGAQRDQLGYLPEMKGVTYEEFEFNVDSSVSRIEALTQWQELPVGDQPDLDYELVGPDGEVIISAGVAGGPEYVNVSVQKPGTYKHRVIGWSNGPTSFTVTSTLTKGSSAPTMREISTEYTDAQGRKVDFDGTFSVAWDGHGDEQGYELERSSDGGQNWQMVASLPGTANSYSFTSQPNGTYDFRVRALTPGRIGYYVTSFSGPTSVTVDRRSHVNITAKTQGSMVPMTYAWNGSTTQLEWTLTNRDTKTYYPHIGLRILRINSTAGGITVANADNGGTGTSPLKSALFDYSSKLGSDEEFGPGEKTGSRLIRFNDTTGQLFSFDVVVTAYNRQASGGSSGGDESSAAGGSLNQEPEGAGLDGLLFTQVMRVTVNPLTRDITVQLLGDTLN